VRWSLTQGLDVQEDALLLLRVEKALRYEFVQPQQHWERTPAQKSVLAMAMAPSATTSVLRGPASQAA